MKHYNSDSTNYLMKLIYLRLTKKHNLTFISLRTRHYVITPRSTIAPKLFAGYITERSNRTAAFLSPPRGNCAIHPAIILPRLMPDLRTRFAPFGRRVHTRKFGGSLYLG